MACCSELANEFCVSTDVRTSTRFSRNIRSKRFFVTAWPGGLSQFPFLCRYKLRPSPQNNTNNHCIAFEVIAAANTKNTVFCDVITFSHGGNWIADVRLLASTKLNDVAPWTPVPSRNMKYITPPILRIYLLGVGLFNTFSVQLMKNFIILGNPVGCLQPATL